MTIWQRRFSSAFVMVTVVAMMIVASVCSAAPGDPVAPGDGEFQIRNKKYGDLLRPEDAKKADQTPIVLYPAQKWKCMTWKFTPAGKDDYSLQNLFTGKTFVAQTTTSADGTTTAVVQVSASADATKRPVWQFKKLSDGTYRITEKVSGHTLSAKATARNDDVRVVLAPWKETDDQKWEILARPEKLDM